MAAYRVQWPGTAFQDIQRNRRGPMQCKDIIRTGLGLVARGLFCATIFVPMAGKAEDKPPAAQQSGVPAVSAADSPEIAALKKEQEKLLLENAVAEQRLKRELARLSEEKSRLELENALNQQKLQAEVGALQAQLEKASRKADLAVKEAVFVDAQKKAKLDAELAAQRAEIERLKVAGELSTLSTAEHVRQLQVKDQDLQLRMKELQKDRMEFDMQVARLASELDLRDKRDRIKNLVPSDIVYSKEPFKKGVLVVSDRRIALNGPIVEDTADYVQARIDYFNNQSSEYPIFIVIDRSPGGSVMAGYKILKAMDGSPAPVYVVVKSFAASMAAGITTMAKRSFAYPNAVILHHQMLSGRYGNLSEQRDEMKEMEEWWRRLASPIAKKMGISLDDFIKQMYKNRASGDWQEFADKARELKWVDDIAETIREESLLKNPDVYSEQKTETPARPGELLREQVDGDGRAYMLLPRLAPVDRYYIYNPDGYYRIMK